MKLLDGKLCAAEVRTELKARVARLAAEGKKVVLAVVRIGDDPASEIYIRNKVRACDEVGIVPVVRILPADTSQAEAEAVVSALSSDPEICGILVQLPLPAGLDEARIMRLIPPEKDVDGFSAQNLGLLASDRPATVACTPQGIMELLRRNMIPLAGKRAVVIGRSNIVGRPMALLLLNADATVTVCHSKTQGLAAICREADLLVCAVGRPNFVTADMVKEGAVVVDVGINRTAGKLCGDVDFAAVAPHTSYITPVPGGVGPMTVAMLLKNCVDAAERQL